MKTQALRSVRAGIVGMVPPAYRPYRHHVPQAILGMVRLVQRRRQRRYQRVLADIGMVLNVSLQRLEFGHAHMKVIGEAGVIPPSTAAILERDLLCMNIIIVVQMKLYIIAHRARTVTIMSVTENVLLPQP